MLQTVEKQTDQEIPKLWELRTWQTFGCELRLRKLQKVPIDMSDYRSMLYIRVSKNGKARPPLKRHQVQE